MALSGVTGPRPRGNGLRKFMKVCIAYGHHDSLSHGRYVRQASADLKKRCKHVDRIALLISCEPIERKHASAITAGPKAKFDAIPVAANSRRQRVFKSGRRQGRVFAASSLVDQFYKCQSALLCAPSSQSITVVLGHNWA